MNNNTYQEALKLRNQILADIEANTDNRTKSVGDKVILWDYSGCVSKQGKHHHAFTGLDGLEAIIIQEKCNFPSPACELSPETFPEGHYNLDLLLLFPNGEEVYTCSEFVKRTDSYLV